MITSVEDMLFQCLMYHIRVPVYKYYNPLTVPMFMSLPGIELCVFVHVSLLSHICACAFITSRQFFSHVVISLFIVGYDFHEYFMNCNSAICNDFHEYFMNCNSAICNYFIKWSVLWYYGFCMPPPHLSLFRVTWSFWWTLNKYMNK